MSIAVAERALYDEVWEHDEYRKWSPGLEAVPRFLRLTGAHVPANVIDFGCGTGRAGQRLALEHGFRVTLADQTKAGVETAALPFVEHCLWDYWPYVKADYGFCCDVLEHIPIELTSLSIAMMLRAVRQSLYLEIATEPDSMGMLVGQTLHKTVKPFVWWRDLCAEIGTVVYGVDLMNRSAFVVEAK